MKISEISKEVIYTGVKFWLKKPEHENKNYMDCFETFMEELGEDIEDDCLDEEEKIKSAKMLGILEYIKDSLNGFISYEKLQGLYCRYSEENEQLEEMENEREKYEKAKEAAEELGDKYWKALQSFPDSECFYTWSRISNSLYIKTEIPLTRENVELFDYPEYDPRVEIQDLYEDMYEDLMEDPDEEYKYIEIRLSDHEMVSEKPCISFVFSQF